MTTHSTNVLASVTGTLMTTDIDDVLVGDIMFMGGHLVRRVWTRPSERTLSGYRVWAGLKLGDPTDGSVSRGEFQSAIGTAVLVLRPELNLLRTPSTLDEVKAWMRELLGHGFTVDPETSGANIIHYPHGDPVFSQAQAQAYDHVWEACYDVTNELDLDINAVAIEIMEESR